MKISVAMFPKLNPQKSWNRDGNPLIFLEARSISTWGVKILSIEQTEILHPSALRQKQVDLLHIHWPASILDFPNYNIPRSAPGIVVILGATLRIRHWARQLEKHKIPVVWQIHDLVSHHAVGTGPLAEADKRLHARIYRMAKGLVFHELSCLRPVQEFYGPSKSSYAVFHLGDYAQVYGPVVSKEEARTRLGLGQKVKVLAYVGTVRKNRNPAEAIQAFLKVRSSDDFLVLAGQGMDKYAVPGRYPNVIVLNGFLPKATIRDIFCASDFIINDGKKYLTSAVLRTAMSYSVPVIAYPYGAALDMTAGASIFIENKEDGLEGALKKSLRIPVEEYEIMVGQAEQRNKERNWHKSGKACVELYKKVLGQS